MSDLDGLVGSEMCIRDSACSEGEWNDRYVDVYEDNQYVGHVFGVCDDILDNDYISPSNYSLNEIYPNPFNPSTEINFSNEFFDNISIKVYDLQGKLVSILSDKYFQPGKHSIVWDAHNLSSGSYIIRMQSSNFESSQLVTLIK